MATTCNLGPNGIRARLLQAVGHTVVLVALVIAMVGFGALEAWRPIVFFPASLATLGYLQGWTKT